MIDNPYDATAKEGIAPTSNRWVRRFAWLAAGLVLFFVLLTLLLPATRRARPAAHRMTCASNLRNISIALNAYNQEYGQFPPAYVIDESGRRLHSWRTLILPFIEQGELYSKIDLSKPWNHPDNAFAFKRAIPVYTCPSVKSPNRRTTYLAVVGEHNAFHPSQGRELAEIIDGTSNTLMLVEADPSQAVHWMSPEDLTAEVLLDGDPNRKTTHFGGFHAAFFDATTRFIVTDMEPSMLKGFLTIDGGEGMRE